MKNELENKETIQNKMKSTEITEIDSIRWPKKRERDNDRNDEKRKNQTNENYPFEMVEHLSELMPNKFC